MSHESDQGRPGGGKPQFATTHWSVVLAASEATGNDSRQALSQLCESYWYPLYAYVRRRVEDPHQAQDLTQAFFTHLLEKNTIGRADPDRGRFRAFLLTSLKNFLTNERDRARAAKRGGGHVCLSLDFESGESRYQIEPVENLTPEKLYERRWILTLLENVLETLRRELVDAGRGEQFEPLKAALTGEATAGQYEAAAAALGISPAAAKQAAYRLRRRYRQLFRAEVAKTVASEEDLDEEIGRLLENLSG